MSLGLPVPPALYPHRMCVYAHSVVSESLQPHDCSSPDSSIHGILQAGLLDWVAMYSPRGSSWPRDQTCVSYTEGRFFPTEPPGSHNRMWLSSKRKGNSVIYYNRDEPWELYSMWNKPDTKRQTLADGEGQGSLVWCSPWGCKVLDMT